MPTSKEFAIRLEDRPGTLGKICKALADRGVNILAFQACPAEGKSLIRMVADNTTTAKSVLDQQHLSYTETDVAQVKLSHRSGELARAAARLGESNININYAYCGVDSATNSPLMIFGCTDASRAATMLDQAVAGAGRT